MPQTPRMTLGLKSADGVPWRYRHAGRFAARPASGHLLFRRPACVDPFLAGCEGREDWQAMEGQMPRDAIWSSRSSPTRMSSMKLRRPIGPGRRRRGRNTARPLPSARAFLGRARAVAGSRREGHGQARPADRRRFPRLARLVSAELGHPPLWTATTRKLKDAKWRGPDGATLHFDVKCESDNQLVLTFNCNAWGAMVPGKPAVDYTVVKTLKASRTGKPWPSA